MRRIAMIALLLCLASCSSGGKDLPMVKDNDPTWPLVPDRLNAAEVPR
jgi:hypothetical protein